MVEKWVKTTKEEQWCNFEALKGKIFGEEEEDDHGHAWKFLRRLKTDVKMVKKTKKQKTKLNGTAV